MKRRARERHEKRENSRPISRRLRAALLRSLKGQHCEKMVCVKGVAGLTGTLGKANSHFDSIHTGSDTTKLRQLLIDAEHSSSQV